MLKINPNIESDQGERVAKLRMSRDQIQWTQSLSAVTKAAQDGTNLMPPIIAAVEARATVGEIADTLRAEFGEHREEA